jgi:hypothetical protein
MSTRWLTPRVALLLLCLGVLASGTIQHQPNVEPTRRTVWLHFGESIALSDFDEDGLIDQARVNRSGLLKSIEIVLTSTSKPVVLRFDTRGGDYGSLFAQDIDKDGATDLIWTDLLHPDDVVIWFGDGNGKFERASQRIYADIFTLGDLNLTAPEVWTQEIAIGAPTNPCFARDAIERAVERVETYFPSNRPERVDALDPALSQTGVRGPPHLLS